MTLRELAIAAYRKQIQNREQIKMAKRLELRLEKNGPTGNVFFVIGAAVARLQNEGKTQSADSLKARAMILMESRTSDYDTMISLVNEYISIVWIEDRMEYIEQEVRRVLAEADDEEINIVAIKGLTSDDEELIHLVMKKVLMEDLIK